MQGILISLATAVILAIGGAFAAPFVVDWNTWRGTFETQMARALGMPVVIRGPIAAEILPSPRVVLRDVTLGDVVSTGGTVQELKAELSLGALLRGEVEAQGVSLFRPRVRLVLDSAGRIALPTGGGRGSTTGIARLVIVDGSLDLLDRGSDRTFALTDLELRGEARSLLGPFRLDGTLAADGARYNVKSSLGRIGGDGSGRLRLSLEPAGTPYALDADGSLGFADLRPAFSGKAALARKGGEGLDSWQLSGTGTATPATLTADTLDLAFGGADLPPQFSGSGRLTLGPAPAAEAELAARSFDLDALRAAAAAPLPRGTSAPLAEVAAALSALPAPGGPSRLRLAADQLMLGGTMVRGARLELAGQPGGWRIASADAQLPGRTALRLSGKPLRQGGGQSFGGDGFEADVALTAEDPAVFLRWALPQATSGQTGGQASGQAAAPAGSAPARGAEPATPADALRDVASLAKAPMKLAARVAAQPDRLSVTGLDASIGASRVTGAISGAPEPAGGYGLELNLGLAGVDLDPVLAALRTAAPAAGRNLSVRLALEGQGLTLAGLPVKKLSLDGTARQGTLRLGKAVLDDWAGLNASASGRLENYAARPEGEFLVTLAGPKADGLVPLARLMIGPEAADAVARLVPLAAPVKLGGTIGWKDGGGQSFAFDGSLGTLTGDARFTRATPGEPVGIALSADAADAGRVLAAFGIDMLAPRLGPGKLRFNLDPLGPDAANLGGRLELAGLTATAEGALRYAGAAAGGQIRPEIAVRLETGDLGRILPQAAAASGNTALPAALGFVVMRGNPGWRLEGLSGSLAGAPMSGRLEFEPGAVPRLGGSLAFDNLSIPRLIGLWAVRTADEGNAAWSTARFQPAAISGVALALDLTARELAVLGPFSLTDARLRLAGDAADLAVREASGAFGGGRAGLSLQVRRRGDAVQADGRLQLDKVDAGVLLAPLKGRAPPHGRVNLALDLGGNGRTLLALVQSIAGQGTLAVADLSVDATSPAAIEAVLGETAGLANPPDERRTAGLLEKAFARGPLVVPAAEATLSVVSGVARLTPTRAMVASTPAAPLPGPMRAGLSGSLDLGRLLMTAGIELEAEAPPGAAAPSAAISWRGPLAAPERRIGASALTSLIAMRAIERETRRLEERQLQVGRPLPPPAEAKVDDAPALPARPDAAAPAPVNPAPAVVAPVAPPPPQAAPAVAAPLVPPPRVVQPPPAAALPPPEPRAPQARTPDAPAAGNPQGIERRPAPPVGFGMPSDGSAGGSAGTASAVAPQTHAAPPADAGEARHAPASPAPAQVEAPSPAAASQTAAPPSPTPHGSDTVRRPPVTPGASRAERRPPPEPAPRVLPPLPPLPQEQSLPPTRGFGDLPRPPGLVGQ